MYPDDVSLDNEVGVDGRKYRTIGLHTLARGQASKTKLSGVFHVYDDGEVAFYTFGAGRQILLPPLRSYPAKLVIQV